MSAALFAELVPGTDARDIDWRGIEEAFGWFRALGACPQDPVFHAEGDVGLHTRLVAEALVADREWAARDADERAVLFWAALLHDVAKPATTRVGLDGRVSAPGHSRRGEIMARRLLWELGVKPRLREAVCGLVAHHQAPLHLIEREAPVRRLHRISQQASCGHLVALARADILGRICPDAGRLLDNTALFRALAEEEACLDAPRAFASDHSRFLYFRKEDRSPDYEAFDDWTGEATLLTGLPASGKDSWLAAHGGAAAVISLDALRDELRLQPGAPLGPVLALARERARAILRSGRPLVWNATNLSRDRRGPLVELFADYRYKVTIVQCEVGADEQHRRNAARERPVPQAAIARMLDHWEAPDLSECHGLSLIES